MNSVTRGIALITGAGGGIGRATSSRLSKDGFALILVGRDRNKLIQTQQLLVTPSVIVAANLVDPKTPELILAASKNPLLLPYPLSALINNAGIIHRQPFRDISEETWREEFEINLLAPVRLIKKLLPVLQDGSVILNVTSTLGLRPITNTSAYSASKAALNNLTQSLALELAPRIRVCAVCPGLIDTPIHSFFSDDEKNQERQQAHLAQPMARMGKPEDVAAMISFLVGPEALWNTGALHVVDGGISLL